MGGVLGLQTYTGRARVAEHDLVLTRYSFRYSGRKSILQMAVSD
jgi:hypothetical protein